MQATPVQPGANASDINLSRATRSGFLTGAVYAAVTGGPVLVTAAAIAVHQLFIAARNEVVANLAQRQLVTPMTAFVIKASTGVLASAVLIIAGIASEIIGPVAATVIALLAAQALVREVKSLQLPVTVPQPPAYPA